MTPNTAFNDAMFAAILALYRMPEPGEAAGLRAVTGYEPPCDPERPPRALSA